MNAAEIIVAVEKAGATLRVEGNSLVASNASKLAPAIKAAIRENKPQIIAALAKPVCAVCGAPDDLWHLDAPSGPVLVHKECVRFSPKGSTVEPSTAYEAISAEPSGATCSLSIIELPAAERYRKTFALLQVRCPSLIAIKRWQQCVEDGKRFLAKWGEQAEVLNWSSRDLFGLASIPDKPHRSYNRLSRYDATGLCWLLEGKKVIAITKSTATIKNVITGNVTVFRKHNKPALGPPSDSLDDFK
jgi:hypothetical protein